MTRGAVAASVCIDPAYDGDAALFIVFEAIDHRLGDDLHAAVFGLLCRQSAVVLRIDGGTAAKP
ncbi:hypothetical protein HBDW_15480 [Herbaspirillum sp. DW155]|uniref:hypothetical protein n=1 Tax=Herbaspirillum sp. DW155 TaxID=3095609 RepID=UPI003093A03F|nr:hypothetical protein HBDW_15480 [Herbaspirillum sp. DW155]